MDLFTFLLGVLLLVVVLALIGSQSKPQANMGACNSAVEAGAVPASSGASKESSRRNMIANNYRTLSEVERGLRTAGLESSDMIIAIDFTKSNSWQGERSFGGLNLHALSSAPGEQNPYQQVIATLSDVLIRRLDDDAVVPLYGFGDSKTANRQVFMMNNEQPCRSKEELLCAYADAAANVTLSGPTSFAPIIREAVDVCKATGKYHALFIIADGVMDDVQETTAAIVDASRHPLSIVMIGVGDGPWDQMETFDDEIPERDFDNFQFVSFTKLLKTYRDPSQRAMHFALDALMELPEQYKFIKRHGLLGRQPDHRVTFDNRLRGKHHYPSSFAEGATGVPGGASPPPYRA